MPFVKKNAKKNRARLIQKIYPVKFPKGNLIKQGESSPKELMIFKGCMLKMVMILELKVMFLTPKRAV
jgi:hypothetical protein